MAAPRKCEVCNCSLSKYCCPRCSTRSCSLTCVSRHKEEIKCNGIRDRTAYVSVKNMSELTLLSDYRLLEETGRCVDNSLRYPLKRNVRQMYQPLPYYLHRLVTECRNRGTCLLVLPSSFKKRKENSTRICLQSRSISWRVEWAFLQSDVTYVDDCVPEDTILGDALNHYMSPDLCNPCIQPHIQFYQSAGFQGVVPLMKVERVQGKEPKYVKLSFSKSLRANLKGITIIEHPTIQLILKDHVQGFSLLESDKLAVNQNVVYEAEDTGTSDNSDEGPVENFLITKPAFQNNNV